jgi:hypothetical protein
MNIVSGIVQQPTKLLLYGVEGVGKTTLVSQLTAIGVNPLFLDTEAGTLKVNLHRIQISNLAAFEAHVKDFIEHKHRFNALVVDTITGLEPMVEAVVLQNTRKKRMGDFDYGKGSVFLREEFDRLLFDLLDQVVAAGFHVILVGHAEVQRTQLPELVEGFDRYQVALDKKVSATLRQWVDHVVFANWDYQVVENSKEETRGVQGRGRALHAVHTAAFDAKNRAGLTDKLAWDPKAFAPLFSAEVKPSPSKESIELQAKFREVLAEFDSRVQVTAFIKSRYSAFNGENWEVIDDNYIKAVLKRTAEFKTAINEFSNSTTAATTAPEPTTAE